MQLSIGNPFSDNAASDLVLSGSIWGDLVALRLLVYPVIQTFPIAAKVSIERAEPSSVPLTVRFR